VKKKLLILSIFLLAFTLRFLWLNVVPNAIGGDELTYVITSKAIYLTGSDISGTWNPLSAFLFNYPPAEKQAELMYFLLLPFVGPFPFSILNVHLVGAILSFLTVVLIFLITKKLFGEKVAFIAAFLASVNPWFIFIGRTAYEMNPAVFFYLLFFYLILVLKNWKILLVIPVLLLAFYSYIATKLLFLPFVALTLIFAFYYLGLKKFKKQYLLVLGFSIVTVIAFVFLLKLNSPSSRMSEILTPFSPIVAESVMSSRKTSINSPILSLVENKLTVFSKIVVSKTTNIFSFDYLFAHGDNFFSLYNHGLFYSLDLILLILGLFTLWSKKKRLFAYLIGFILISITPQIFFADFKNFTPHIALLFPFLIIIAALGAGEIISLLKKSRFFYLGVLLFLGIYLFSVVNFLNIYFFQFPLKGHMDFSLRVMSKYLVLAEPIAKKDGMEIVVLSPRNSDLYKKFLFYGNIYNKENAALVSKNLKDKNPNYNGIEFIACNSEIDLNDKKLYVYNAECKPLDKRGEKLIISRPSDGGEQFSIYNDSICSKFDLDKFPLNANLSDFKIEQMNLDKFCKTFIFKQE